LIGWTWQSTSVAHWVCLSRKRHPSGHNPFEPAHPIAQIGELLTHPRHITRGVAYTLVEQDDLA
jgi:hypothetical protein